MPNTAKIFQNGRSQAVRIPKEFAFEGVRELWVRRDGNRLILEPVRKSWLSFNEDSEPVGDDFMKERPRLFAADDERVAFE